MFLFNKDRLNLKTEKKPVAATGNNAEVALFKFEIKSTYPKAAEQASQCRKQAGVLCAPQLCYNKHQKQNITIVSTGVD